MAIAVTSMAINRTIANAAETRLSKSETPSSTRRAISSPRCLSRSVEFARLESRPCNLHSSSSDRHEERDELPSHPRMPDSWDRTPRKVICCAARGEQQRRTSPTGPMTRCMGFLAWRLERGRPGRSDEKSVDQPRSGTWKMSATSGEAGAATCGTTVCSRARIASIVNESPRRNIGARFTTGHMGLHFLRTNDDSRNNDVTSPQ